MNVCFKEITKGMTNNPGLTNSQLALLVASLSKPIPVDFIEFLKFTNGLIGMMGNNYLEIWKAEELLAYNQELHIAEYTTELILFGSDGGGEAYGFDYREESGSPVIVEIPFVGLKWEDAIKKADTFVEFLQKIRNQP